VPTLKIRESKAYYVQNLSDQDRDFTVDHIIRPDGPTWVKRAKRNRARTFSASPSRSPRAKTGSQEVDEEKIYTDKGKASRISPTSRFGNTSTIQPPTPRSRPA